MAITATDILFKFSGGASNNDPNASLGGAMSSVQISDATLNNLFDNVSGDEAAAGDVEFRALFVQNNHGTLTLSNTYLWIQTQTPATGDDVAIGIEATNGTPKQTIVNESTAPSSPTITFSSPLTKGAGLNIGSIAPGECRMIWVRRTVNAGASAYNTDNFVLKVEGDTPA